LPAGNLNYEKKPLSSFRINDQEQLDQPSGKKENLPIAGYRRAVFVP
jgi:hypothetical protein